MNNFKILKKITLFLSIFLITGIFQGVVSDNINYELENNSISIVIGPFPQKIELNSSIIVWETSVNTTNNCVKYGINPDCELNMYHNYSRNFHTIELNELNSSTKYYYKVYSDGIESKVYSFYTKFEKEDTIKFVAYGDTRGVWDGWNNASRIADSIEKVNPYFVLHTGDLVKNGNYYDQWLDFFSISNFIHNSTLYPSLGNHEYYGDSYFKYFLLLSKNPWYSFDNGPVHFICLDSNAKNSLRLSQIFWLIKDLRQNTNPFTIVYFHHPPYSSGNHGSTIYLRFIWGLIFEYFKVDIVFNGHDHSYEHGKVKNVTYIVTGGGGAPLYNTGHKWWTIFSEKTYHYCLITCDIDELTCEAIKPDGTIFDYFVINK
jgi:hypothetical protein